ncbi:MAG: hypothetical protein RL335_666, partial [Bacteroidota bacterium]
MRIVFLLAFVLLSAVSIAQKKKTSPAAEAKPATNIESYFRSLQWRNIGPHRGGRSVASS